MFKLKHCLLIIFISISVCCKAKCTFSCNVRFVTNPIKNAPVLRGKIVGKPNGNWSSLYNLKVTFYSGFEYNKEFKFQLYKDFAILAVIKCMDGSEIIVQLKEWKADNLLVNEKEIKYAGDKKIALVTALDLSGRNWEIYYL